MVGSLWVPSCCGDSITILRITFCLDRTAFDISPVCISVGMEKRGLVDPVCIGQLAGDNSSLPGVQLDLLSLLTGGHAVANSDCANQLDRSDVVGFPHHVELQYAMLNANATPKISITTSTSAGLEQIIPQLYYHLQSTGHDGDSLHQGAGR